MNKKYLIAIMGLVLFIVGCAGDTTEQAVAGESPYIGGNKGMIAEFEEMGIFNEETNMEEIFEDETFPIEVALRNKGEEPIAASGATVTLMGINLADFTGIPAGELLNTAEIEGISEFNEEGGEATLDFTGGANDAQYTIPLTGMSYDVSVFANVIYDYKTHAAVPKVCFKGNLNNPAVCKVDEVKDVYSSAAPIQVNSVEEKRAGTGKVSVEFRIENVGTGKVTKPGADFDSRYDQLSYTVSDASNWECKSGGRVNEARLSNDGKATVLCKWIGTTLTDNDLYTKQLDLTLNYKYKDIIHKQIRINKQ